MEGVMFCLQTTNQGLILRALIQVFIAYLAVNRPKYRAHINCNCVNLNIDLLDIRDIAFFIHGKTGPYWTPKLSLVIRSSSGVFHR
jgi:hypothetical protein